MMRISKKSEELYQRACRVTPGGVHSPVRAFRGVDGKPLFIQSAMGDQLKDVDGNLLIDYCMSWGPLILGHQESDILLELQGALARGWSFGAAEPYSLELAELLTRSIPCLEKVRFVNSGTEAVMSVLRVARAATGRDKIIKFDGCYHGHVDSMLVRAGSGLADMAEPDSGGVSKQVSSETIVAPLDDLEAVQRIFEEHGKNIAAVIIEPLPANFGLLIQRKEFLEGLAQLARQRGSLLIFDEVISGFRVGFGGMSEWTGISPDLITYGKIIGGGFPVGAYGGRRDLMELVAPNGPVYQAGTLSGNPIAMTAGLATLKKLRADNPYASLEKDVEELAQVLEQIGKERGFPIQVQRFASMFWMVFGEENKSSFPMIRTPKQIPSGHKRRFTRIFHKVFKRGIYLPPSAFEVSFISTAHMEMHHEKFVQAMREAIIEVQNE